MRSPHDEPSAPQRATVRLYLQDSQCLEAEATVVALRDDAVAFDRSCFYPGGGGQPPDEGVVRSAGGEALEIVSVQADADDVVWHLCKAPPSPALLGRRAHLSVNARRRSALTRYHTVLHILNTLALRDHAGWITGAQIGAEYSRIDFKLDGFSPALCADMERKTNVVIDERHPVRARYVPEEEFRRRGDLIRTLDVTPPVIDGQVRVVEIEGFDAQACGGTHVANTAEIGRLTIFRTENKGKNNKRLYVRLFAP